MIEPQEIADDAIRLGRHQDDRVVPSEQGGERGAEGPCLDLEGGRHRSRHGEDLFTVLGPGRTDHDAATHPGGYGWPAARSVGHFGGRLARRVDHLGEQVVGVGQAGEQDLVGARGERHPAAQHGVEERRVHPVAGPVPAPSVVDGRDQRTAAPGARKSPTSGPDGGHEAAGRPRRWPPRELAANDRGA